VVEKDSVNKKTALAGRFFYLCQNQWKIGLKPKSFTKTIYPSAKADGNLKQLIPHYIMVFIAVCFS